MGGIGEKHKLFLSMTAEDLQQARYFNRIKLNKFIHPPKQLPTDQHCNLPPKQLTIHQHCNLPPKQLAVATAVESELSTKLEDDKFDVNTSFNLDLVVEALKDLQDLRANNEDGIRLLHKTDERSIEMKKGFDLLFEGLRKLLDLQNKLYEACEAASCLAHKEHFLQNDNRLPIHRDRIREKVEDKVQSASDGIDEHLDCADPLASLPKNSLLPEIKLEQPPVSGDEDLMTRSNDLHFDSIASVKVETGADVNVIEEELDMNEYVDDALDSVKSLLDKASETENRKDELFKEEDEKYSCLMPQIDQVFSKADDLKSHKSVHEEYSCDICNKLFSTRQTLKVHMRVHTGEKPFKCDQCSKACSQLATLIRHKRTHTGEKPYKCDQCGKDFRENSALKTHMRIHTGEKPFSCDECELKFAHQAGLRSHKMLRHVAGNETERKPFKCDQCYKDFSFKNQLRTHMRTHTGERPYQCEFCMKSFTDYSTLKYHIKVHKGEKDYKCDICGKTWIRQSNLRNHMRTHTGEKPFKCKVCDKDFSRKDRLKSHEKKHCQISDMVDTS